MNKLTTLELVNFVLESIELNKKRFLNINKSDDFLSCDDNITKMEAIMMRLQASGEAIKNIDKRGDGILLKVGSRDYWSKIIRFRDLLSHHYSDIQADEIYDICKNKIDELEKKMKKLKELLL
jgi:uncharacterized protein with HEPN domain